MTELPIRGPTPYQAFCARWREGCGSTACPNKDAGHTGKVVFARGKVPCEILFVGEAPGESEEVVGQPFVGPAGKLLDHIVGRAVPPGRRIGFTNVVCCVPRKEDGGKTAQPDDDQVLSCRPRLEEFIKLCNPRLLVAVGSVAREYLRRGFKHSVNYDPGVALVEIMHPAYLLRLNVAQRGLEIQRCVVAVKNGIQELDGD